MSDADGVATVPAWERLAPLGGVAFVVLDVVVALIGGEPPATDAPADVIARHYRHTQPESRPACGCSGSPRRLWADRLAHPRRALAA